MAVSALVEDIFSREVTKLGTHFSVKKLITTEERRQCPGFLLIFRQFGCSSVFRHLSVARLCFFNQALRWYGFLHLPHFNLRSYFLHHCDRFCLHYILLRPGLPSLNKHKTGRLAKKSTHRFLFKKFNLCVFGLNRWSFGVVL